MAYKIDKELDRRLKEKKSNLTPEKAIDIAKTIYAIRVKHPISKDEVQRTLLITQEHHRLAKLFDFKPWVVTATKTGSEYNVAPFNHIQYQTYQR